MSLIFLVLAGALGALAKDIIQADKFTLPQKINTDLFLGSLGGLILGGAAGFFIDGSPQTAFLAGFTGTSTLTALLAKKTSLTLFTPQTVEAIIRSVALNESVDPALAVRVAQCESSLDPNAEHSNSDGSLDRGLFQINDHWHPDVDAPTAFDPELSTRFFCKAFKAGHLDWWSATKKCWAK